MSNELDLFNKHSVSTNKNIYVKNNIRNSESNSFYRSYLKSKRKNLPFVTAKLAVSKDFFTVNKKNNGLLINIQEEEFIY